MVSSKGALAIHNKNKPNLRPFHVYYHNAVICTINVTKLAYR